MKFLSKGKNLSNLKSLNLQKSKIPKFYNFSIDEILKNKKKIIDLVFNELKKKISIRSSYFLEDNYFSSMAGEFDGLYNIQNTKYNILKGISYLAEQYKKKIVQKKFTCKVKLFFKIT